MSDLRTDRFRLRGGLTQALMYWTLIGLSWASHRPFSKEERYRNTRHLDKWAQRIHYPSLHDQGSQRVQYPSVNDRGAQQVLYPSLHGEGQEVQYPSVSVNEAGSQIQVK